MKVSAKFARIVTAPDGAQMLIYLYLTERGTYLHHTMIAGQIQLEFKIGPYPYSVAYELLFKELDEERMISELLSDPVRTFNELTENGTVNTPYDKEEGGGKLPPPSLN